MNSCIKINIPELDSTNNYLNKILQNGTIAEFTSVYTDFQTAGKGMSTNVWESEKSKNLLCSLVLYPTDLNAEKQFYISKVVAIAVLQTVKHLIPEYSEFSIKWPNDIYAANKKIGGILIENSYIGNSIQYSICGIGLNINQEFFSETIPNPSSLCLIAKSGFVIKDVLDMLQRNLQLVKLEITKQNFTHIDYEYHSNLLKINQLAKFEDGNGSFEAKIIGTNEFGYLRLQKLNDLIEEYEVKAVRMIF